MKRKFIQAVKSVKTTSTLLLFSLLCSPVLAAGLPKVDDPSRGQGKGIFETLKNYLYDFVILTGLVISVAALCAVAWNIVAVFIEVQKQKKSYADLGMVVIVGVLLIVACIWLLTKAAEIL